MLCVYLMAFGFLSIVFFIAARILFNWMEGGSVLCNRSRSTETAESEGSVNTGGADKEMNANVLGSVDFEDVLRKFLLIVLSVAKWFAYLTLSLLVLLIFIPKLFNFSGDDLWYILACIGVVAVYPIYSICKHWSYVSRAWAFVSGTFADFRKWLHKEPKAE